ncbi:hypothetical protein NM688_g3955 [Phlebia brevispora]|uniref:Uncharacterized protein n=1 Tax=Phlebia brevispora TaxID=194682 RepID=A0ACC1T4B6_9APHY|nr:hypothetical protein NM688_g3955 [Phlebia brevispora]
MDELVHHCIRELAFDGNLGCDVSRLRDFINGFYTHEGVKQNIDDAFCAFVWSVVVQQPEVRVGTAPEGAPEVFIAPQQSRQPAGEKTPKSKKKGAGGGKDVEDIVKQSPLHVIPDAVMRPLEELKAQYGDALRIAVAPEAAFVALTGSHVVPRKLTPMVYTALQFVSRGRENGISVVDLSRKTGYDAKTCHYLVEKLLELNHIEKRKKSGVGANFCIHKYFFERSEKWQAVKAEERKATQALTIKTEDIPFEDEEDALTTPAPHLGTIQFEPMDSESLHSSVIVRARLEKLLKNSPHNMHASQNLLVTIGYPNPSKSDRRFFQSLLRELVAQRVIEKVQVPRPNGKPVACIRLFTPDEPGLQSEEDHESEEERPTLKTNVGFHRQIVDLVEGSGMEGVTLNELSEALCGFDKRIIEHQLMRLLETPPPHLADLCIAQTAESHGRW